MEEKPKRKARKRDTLVAILGIAMILALPVGVYKLGGLLETAQTETIEIKKETKIGSGQAFKVYSAENETLVEDSEFEYKGYDRALLVTRYSTWEEEYYVYHNKDMDLYIKDNGRLKELLGLEVGETFTKDIIVTNYNASEPFNAITANYGYIELNGVAEELILQTSDNLRTLGMEKGEAVKSLKTSSLSSLNKYTGVEKANINYTVTFNVLAKENSGKSPTTDVEVYVDELEATLKVRADIRDLVEDKFKVGATGVGKLVETYDYNEDIYGIIEIEGLWYTYER